jgi:hypothetical protein
VVTIQSTASTESNHTLRITILIHFGHSIIKLLDGLLERTDIISNWDWTRRFASHSAIIIAGKVNYLSAAGDDELKSHKSSPLTSCRSRTECDNINSDHDPFLPFKPDVTNFSLVNLILKMSALRNSSSRLLLARPAARGFRVSAWMASGKEDALRMCLRLPFQPIKTKEPVNRVFERLVQPLLTWFHGINVSVVNKESDVETVKRQETVEAKKAEGISKGEWQSELASNSESIVS